MKIFSLLTFIFSMLPIFSQAQLGKVERIVHSPEGEIVLDVVSACEGKKQCIINFGIGVVKITGNAVVKGDLTYSAPIGLAGTSSTAVRQAALATCVSVESTLPITAVLVRSYRQSRPDTFSVDLNTFPVVHWNAIGPAKFEFEKPVTKFAYDCQETLSRNGNPYLSIVSLAFLGSPKSLALGLSHAGQGLYTIYQNTLNQLNQLTGSLRRSDRPHMDRLKASIQSAMDAFVLQKEVITVPVTHQNVQESARMVVAMGTVMEEIFSEYDDVATTQLIIENIRELVSQLRMSYGWTNGLAGAPSKAMSAIGVVLETTLRELLINKDALDSNMNRTIYTQLRFKAMALKAAVKGRAGGDASVAKEVQAFANDWNSQAWQNELYSLINAGKDTENNVQTKVKLLLMGVGSLNDLTGVQFEEGLRYTPETKSAPESSKPTAKPATSIVPVKKP